MSPRKRSRSSPPSARAQRRARQLDQPRREDARVAPALSWFQAKSPVLRFVVVFGLLMGVFYLLTFTAFAENTVWPAYLRLNARVSAGILELLGQDVTVVDRAILSPRSSLSIERGCDAIHPSALFLSAVLASPVLFWTKLPGIVVGTAALMVLNLVRIVSLFYVQMYWPQAFEVMHVEVWQALFIFLAVLFWVVWASWAIRHRETGDPEPASG